MAVTYACSDIHGYYNAYEQVKQYIKPDDKVIFLGDAGDRGPQSWETIKAIYNDPQFVYLKGNHEDLFARGARSDGRWRHIWFMNGGEQTYNDFSKGTCEAKQEWIKKIAELPLTYNYTSPSGKRFWLSHTSDYISEGDEREFLWSRLWWNTPVPDGYDFSIHGHTPRPDWIPCIYMNDTKYNLDAGVFVSKKFPLLNLDTLEIKIFNVKD